MHDNRRRLLFTNCMVWTGEVGSAARRGACRRNDHRGGGAPHR